MRSLLLALTVLAAPLARADEVAPAEPPIDAAAAAPAPAPAAAPATPPVAAAPADAAQPATATADAAQAAAPEAAQPAAPVATDGAQPEAPATADATPAGTVAPTPGDAALPPPPEPPVAPAAPVARTYAGEPPLPPPPVPRAVAPVAKVRRGGAGRFGFMLEAGVPQGATASLTYRPLSFMRLWAGPSWDYAGFGAQGGLMLAPFWSWVAPTLSIEAGRFLDADLTPIADRFQAEVPVEVAPLLRNVRLEYVAAHVGLEFGSRHFALSIRAGLAKMRVIARGRGGSDEFFMENPTLVAAVPTVKVGLQTTF